MINDHWTFCGAAPQSGLEMPSPGARRGAWRKAALPRSSCAALVNKRADRTEAADAAWLSQDKALTGGFHDLGRAARRGEKRDHAAIASAAALLRHAGQLLEQQLVVGGVHIAVHGPPPGGRPPPRRAPTGRATQRLDLDPGIGCDGAQHAARPAVPRLRGRR